MSGEEIGAFDFQTGLDGLLSDEETKESSTSNESHAWFIIALAVVAVMAATAYFVLRFATRRHT